MPPQLKPNPDAPTTPPLKRHAATQYDDDACLALNPIPATARPAARHHKHSIRGAKDAAKYKDHILPLIFTKRLCDVFEKEGGHSCPPITKKWGLENPHSFFNPHGEIGVTKNHLPHWQQGEAWVFVTWRLGDSLPKAKLDQWKNERDSWMTHHPEPWDEKTEAEYHERFSRQIDEWLDQGSGSCLLKDPANASVVAHALRHFDGDRLIRNEQHFFKVAEYIRENPVKAKLEERQFILESGQERGLSSPRPIEEKGGQECPPSVLGRLEAKVRTFCAIPQVLAFLKNYIVFAEK